jgi:hypothetical protein
VDLDLDRDQEATVTMLVAGVVQQAGSAMLKAKVLPEVLSGDALCRVGYRRRGSRG